MVLMVCYSWQCGRNGTQGVLQPAVWQTWYSWYVIASRVADMELRYVIAESVAGMVLRVCYSQQCGRHGTQLCYSWQCGRHGTPGVL